MLDKFDVDLIRSWLDYQSMRASSYSSAFCVTGPLWADSTRDQWIFLTNDRGVEFWCYLWSMPEQKVEQTVEMPVIWDNMEVMWRHCNADTCILP